MKMKIKLNRPLVLISNGNNFNGNIPVPECKPEGTRIPTFNTSLNLLIDITLHLEGVSPSDIHQ